MSFKYLNLHLTNPCLDSFDLFSQKKKKTASPLKSLCLQEC